MARQARDGRHLPQARRDHAEADPPGLAGRLRDQGGRPLRPVLPHGVGGRARHRPHPRRALRPHPVHAARLLRLAALGGAHDPRGHRRQPPRPALLHGAGDGGAPRRHHRRAAHRHVPARVAAHPDRDRGLSAGGPDHPRDRPQALQDQQADPAEDRGAERGAPGVVHRHQDREGLRARAARAGAVRPRQRPPALPRPSRSAGGRDGGAGDGGPRRPRHHGRPLVRRLPGDRGRPHPRRVLLLHRRGDPPLRPGPPDLPHGQHRAAVHRLGGAGVRDPGHPARHRGRARRPRAPRLHRVHRLRGGRLLLSGGGGVGPAGYLADGAQGRAGGLRRHVGGGQDHPDGIAAALPRRHRRAHHAGRARPADRSRWPRCAR